MIVIMNSEDYKNEILRQLNNENYYEKCHHDPTDTIKCNISKCVNDIEVTNSRIQMNLIHFLSIFAHLVFMSWKIHKSPDTNLPLRYPGRPIVSACNSPTENISKYIDHVLKPHMLSLPSYVKDTTDFINKVRNIKIKSKNTFLVTLDVSSLYTNIPHDDGITAREYFLQQDIHSSKLSSDEITRL